MARNQRRRAQEALFSPAPSTTPPDEEKAAERTETTETDVPAAVPAAPSPADYIYSRYGIEPNCTNVPRLLYAILREVVRGRV
jgi:hypothetical protein